MGSGEGYYCTLIVGDIEDRFTNSSSVDSHQKSHPILSIKTRVCLSLKSTGGLEGALKYQFKLKALISVVAVARTLT